MQKLLKRTAQAERQAARRAKQQLKSELNDGKLQSRSELRRAMTEIRQNLKQARTAMREDWELGPLAPKRDLGFNTYGATQAPMRLDWSCSGFAKPAAKLVEQRCAWAGRPKQLNLASGDRVVIMDGPDQGKVDRISSVDTDNGSVKLETYHKAVTTNPINNTLRSEALPISVASVRLVYPLRNPETGVVRDVIINQLKAVPPNMQSDNMSLDRWEYGKKWDRLVPGLNVVIPWPEVEPPQFETTEADTVREQVEKRTFHYNLLGPPMPEQVLDELRNKYSRFRTRHEAWYVAQKEAEAATKKKGVSAEAMKSMRTPLDEFHEKQRELRRAQEEPQLTDDMLEKLGQIMAKNKEAASTRPATTDAP
ncbi:hypothetical protein CDD83_10231 [Cordyceps sp. RAO-2017]|nr:hypothetical protein CDD83_10231 [Cordyceps sp. RAO-2017]